MTHVKALHVTRLMLNVVRSNIVSTHTSARLFHIYMETVVLLGLVLSDPLPNR